MTCGGAVSESTAKLGDAPASARFAVVQLRTASAGSRPRADRSGGRAKQTPDGHNPADLDVRTLLLYSVAGAKPVEVRSSEALEGALTLCTRTLEVVARQLCCPSWTEGVVLRQQLVHLIVLLPRAIHVAPLSVKPAAGFVIADGHPNAL